MITTHKINENLTWYEVVNPNQEEQDKLNKQGITSEFLFYALDSNESARTEIDYQSGNILVIFDILVPGSDVTTEPVAMIFNNDGNFYTIARENTSIVSELILKTSTQKIDEENMSAIDMFLNGVFVIMSEYINAVKNVNRRRNVIQTNLSKRVGVRDVVSLTELNTKIIYLSDSLVTDRNAIIQLKNLFDNKISDRQKEFFNDIVVENDQAISMSKQAKEVIFALSETYSSIHNQNLDRSLRILTVVQAVMAVPTVITGFYGMNTFLPLASNNNTWLGVIVASILIMGLVIYTLVKINFFDNK